MMTAYMNNNLYPGIVVGSNWLKAITFELSEVRSFASVPGKPKANGASLICRTTGPSKGLSG
jgi:hypothetical protein